MGLAAAHAAPEWIPLEAGDYQVDGTVRAAGFNHGQYQVELVDYSIAGERYRGRALLKQYSDIGDFRPGETVRAECRFKMPAGHGNSSDFDYKTYLYRNGVTAYGQILAFQKGAANNRPGSLARFRCQIVTYLDNQARPEAEILKAILTGDKSGLTYTHRDTFSSLGISHLLAISGLHMGLIMLIGYIICFSVLRIIPVISVRLDTPLIAKIAGLLTIIIYFLFIEESVPTLRALIMAVIVVYAFLAMRPFSVLGSLALAGIIILILWPLSIYTPSFLLSFGAALGIILCTQTIKTKSRILGLVVVTTSAFVFTFPTAIRFFGFISPWSLPTNLFAVPFFSFIIMPLAIIGLIINPFWRALSDLCLGMSMEGIGLLLRLGEKFGKFMIIPNMGEFWGYETFGLFLIMFMVPRSRFKVVTMTVLAASVPLSIAFQHPQIRHPELIFDFINTGYGKCLLVTKEDFAMLIDAGGSSGWDTGRFIIVNHLLQRGIHRLDIVAMTNTGNPSIGGMPAVIEKFSVGEIWVNQDDARSPKFKDVTRIAQMKSIPLRRVGLGDIMMVKDIKIEILNPQLKQKRSKGNLGPNLHSMVLRIGDENMKVLYMSGCSGFGELSIAHLGCELQSDILVTANTPKDVSCYGVFLDKVRPRYAVINGARINKAAVARMNSRRIELVDQAEGEALFSSSGGRVHLKSAARDVDICYAVYAPKNQRSERFIHVR